MQGKILRTILCFLIVCFTGSLLASDLVGIVQSSTGETVSGARISITGTKTETFSDREGSFHLRISTFPVELSISHPDFLEQRFTIGDLPNTSVHIEMVPRIGLSEEIVVTARMPQSNFSPIGSSASMVPMDSLPVPATTISDLVTSIPGIAPNGQGGMFQVYSVRGVSRHRVLTSIGGVRITTDRRAGVSASFVDPFLIDGADVLRGPSSGFYGSGALGGVVDLHPKHFDMWNLDFGYQTVGHQNHLAAGWGDSLWSVGFVRRQAWNASDPTGAEINSHFTQYSSVIQKKWDLNNNRLALTLIPTYGEDIGKANTDFPRKPTNYPRERHLISHLKFETKSLWTVETFIHPQDLHTRQTEERLETNVVNDSFDFGARVNKESWIGTKFRLLVGADYAGRRSVDSLENNYDAENGINETWKSLDGGNEDELGLVSSLSISLGRLDLEAGGRFSLFHQGNRNNPSISDHAWSGFGGGRFALTESIELQGSVGSGLRFANLSERFYTGTTGRGQIIGNPDLLPERSLNFEAGVRWLNPKVILSGFAFRNRIRNYIERVEVEPDVLTYLNITSGVIKGLEWEGVFNPRNSLQFFFRGHLIQGIDQAESYLSDIPVNRYHWGFRNSSDRLDYGLGWEFRERKDHLGSGEKRIPSVHLLSAFLHFGVTSSIKGQVSATNLLNQEYYPTADSKTALAPGTGVSFGISWTSD
jgi:iron complex outermembrane receptor protein